MIAASVIEYAVPILAAALGAWLLLLYVGMPLRIRRRGRFSRSS